METGTGTGRKQRTGCVVAGGVHEHDARGRHRERGVRRLNGLVEGVSKRAAVPTSVGEEQSVSEVRRQACARVCDRSVTFQFGYFYFLVRGKHLNGENVGDATGQEAALLLVRLAADALGDGARLLGDGVSRMCQLRGSGPHRAGAGDGPTDEASARLSGGSLGGK